MSRRAPVTHPLQSTGINRYLVLRKQISHHTDSLHLESLVCCSKHHSNCVLLVGIPDVQTFGIYWESPEGVLENPFELHSWAPFSGCHSWHCIWSTCLSFCHVGEANPLSCLKTFNFFHIQLLLSWEEFLSWLVLKSFQITINSLMFISKYARFR